MDLEPWQPLTEGANFIQGIKKLKWGSAPLQEGYLLWSGAELHLFTVQKYHCTTINKIVTQCRQLLLEHFPWSKVLGLPAHDAVFIFFTYLTGLFKSSVFNFFKMHSSSLANVAMFYLHSSTRKKIKFFTSSFFNMEENWVLHIFILQCRLEHIFIFVFKLNLASSNLPENSQGAPVLVFVAALYCKGSDCVGTKTCMRTILSEWVLVIYMREVL